MAKFRTFGSLEDKAAIRIRQQLEAILPAQGADWLTIGKVWKSFIGKGLAGGIA